MLQFSFNIQNIVQEFSLQPSEVDALSNYVLDRIITDYEKAWMELVNKGLHNTITEYKKGIYSDRPDSRTAVIGLNERDSKLAMMIETGNSAFDEKGGFSHSLKKTMKKDGVGWYLTIPLQHATSEAIMGMEAGDMGVTVLDLMKSGGTTTPQTLPQPFQEVQTHELALNTGSIISYTHKAPIYEGMKRIDQSSTEKEKRGGYFTFRRVSDKSDESAWMHPGFEARNFMDKALEQANLVETVSNSVQDFIDAKFG